MIELRAVVVAKGMAPIDAIVRRGEVVRVVGPAASRHALFEVLAKQRKPISGSVHWADDATPVLVRATDILAPGLSDTDALHYYAAAWGRTAVPPPVRDRSAFVARGLVIDANVWLVADPVNELAYGAEAIVDKVADELRTGRGVLIIADNKVRSDRQWDLEPLSSPTIAQLPRISPGHQVSPLWRRLIALELKRSLRQPATPAMAAIGIALAYMLWSLMPTYEEYWFAPGGVAGYHLSAHLAAVIAAVASGIYGATFQLCPDQVMVETPLGRRGFRRLQRIGALVPVVALCCSTAVVSVWAYRTGATGLANATFYIGWPLATAVIGLASAELLDSARTPRAVGAVLAASLAAVIGVFVGGFGMLW